MQISDLMTSIYVKDGWLSMLKYLSRMGRPALNFPFTLSVRRKLACLKKIRKHLHLRKLEITFVLVSQSSEILKYRLFSLTCLQFPNTNFNFAFYTFSNSYVSSGVLYSFVHFTRNHSPSFEFPR